MNIGTHNSATGEKGKGFLSWIGSIFAKCQSKTIKEQYEAGSRFFDIRVKKYKDGLWHCAHGLWMSSKPVTKILEEINGFPEKSNVIITFEGNRNDSNFSAFLSRVNAWKWKYPNINWVYAAVKKPKWEILYIWDSYIKSTLGFTPIIGWRKMIPIPLFWHYIAKVKYSLNNKDFVLFDFL